MDVANDHPTFRILRQRKVLQFLASLSACMCVSQEDTTKADLEKFYGDHAVPLVGQRTRDNMNKRYSKRPLVVVYYDVDFSYDYR